MSSIAIYGTGTQVMDSQVYQPSSTRSLSLLMTSRVMHEPTMHKAITAMIYGVLARNWYHDESAILTDCVFHPVCTRATRLEYLLTVSNSPGQQGYLCRSGETLMG